MPDLLGLTTPPKSSTSLAVGALGAVLLIMASGCASRHLYWGDVHGHTAYSDGKGSVADYLTYARDVANLDFVMVTDHDFGHEAPWRLAQEEWDETQETVEAFNHPSSFVAITGYEWTSQPKYWSGYEGETPSERLFEGPPRYFNHKNVYLPRPVPYLFSAKAEAYRTPDQLAAAVEREGGLIHNNHPVAGPEGRDQWDYTAESARVIVNTEMMADTILYGSKAYDTSVEKTVNEYLAKGGRTGFVGSTDTHEGKPSARTGVWARGLNREDLFAALRQRCCYAISHARIELEFHINGHAMGDVVEVGSPPKIKVNVRGTDRITEVTLFRNGVAAWRFEPNQETAKIRVRDHEFAGDAYYYVRVTQTDVDAHGNPSRAWSSPIWVRSLQETRPSRAPAAVGDVMLDGEGPGPRHGLGHGKVPEPASASVPGHSAHE